MRSDARGAEGIDLHHAGGQQPFVSRCGSIPPGPGSSLTTVAYSGGQGHMRNNERTRQYIETLLIVTEPARHPRTQARTRAHTHTFVDYVNWDGCVTSHTHTHTCSQVSVHAPTHIKFIVRVLALHCAVSFN